MKILNINQIDVTRVVANESAPASKPNTTPIRSMATKAARNWNLYSVKKMLKYRRAMKTRSDSREENPSALRSSNELFLLE